MRENPDNFESVEEQEAALEGQQGTRGRTIVSGKGAVATASWTVFARIVAYRARK